MKFHELSDAKVKTLTWAEGQKYWQPDWCGMYDAISPLGCWSLIGDMRKKISKKFCKNCNHYTGGKNDKSILSA